MNPIKPTIKTEIIPLLCLVAAFVLSPYFYVHFPEQVPTHWNFQGEIDGYGSKVFAAFFFPALIAGIYLLLLLVPRLDPKKERYAQFQKVYHIFKSILILFFFLMYLVSSLSALGLGISPANFVPLAIGALFVVLGNYMAKIKPNWFMGIRTPWTMSSEAVWNKTHRLGGKLFVLSGLVFISMPWLNPSLKIIGFVAVITILTAGTFLYSYIIYRQEEKKKVLTENFGK